MEFVPHLPLIIQLFHGPAHLRHDIVGSTLTPDAQVPLGPPDTLVLGLLGVQLVQRVAGPGRRLRQEEGDALGVHLDDAGHRRAGRGQVLVVQERVGGAGGQVEILGFVHDAAIVNDEMVGDGQRILVVATIYAGQDLLLCALKLVTHLLQGLVVDHVVAVGGVLREQVLR